MGMKRGRKKYATTWQKKVYFIDRSPNSAKLRLIPAKPLRNSANLILFCQSAVVFRQTLVFFRQT